MQNELKKGDSLAFKKHGQLNKTQKREEEAPQGWESRGWTPSGSVLRLHAVSP